MNELSQCPKCNSEYTYEDGRVIVCPECAHDWPISMEGNKLDEFAIKDANGNILHDGN